MPGFHSFRPIALCAALAAGSLCFGALLNSAQAATPQTAGAKQAASSANAAAPTPPDNRAEYLAAQDEDQWLASPLLGLDVRSTQSEDASIGQISNLVLSPQGQVSGIVIGVGGFLGIGEKTVGMPWQRLQEVDVAEHSAQVAVDRAELEAAPEFKVRGADADTDSDSDTANAKTEPAPRADAAPGDYLTYDPATEVLARDLIDMEIKNKHGNNEKIGTVSDLILDADGTVLALLTSVGGFLGIGEKSVAMPWDRIQHFDAKDKVLRVIVTEDELDAAPPFTPLQHEADAAIMTSAQAQPLPAQKDAAGSYLAAPDAADVFGTELQGMAVHGQGTEAEALGTVLDLLVGADGQPHHLIVGVGGVLGIGEKKVAIPWNHIVGLNAEEKTVQVSADRDALTNAPDFHRSSAE